MTQCERLSCWGFTTYVLFGFVEPMIASLAALATGVMVYCGAQWSSPCLVFRGKAGG